MIPASDEEADKLIKFKTGEHYEVDIKLPRNPAFHRKVFAFFGFCFDHWSSNKTQWDHMSELSQKESFRKQLIVLAGFSVTSYSIDGLSFVVEPESLAFASMTQERFEECYSALINAAMRTIFKSSDEKIYNRLVSFF